MSDIPIDQIALRLMQEHYRNKYLSFKCVSPKEEMEWYRKAAAQIALEAVHGPQVSQISGMENSCEQDEGA